MNKACVGVGLGLGRATSRSAAAAALRSAPPSFPSCARPHLAARRALLASSPSSPRAQRRTLLTDARSAPAKTPAPFAFAFDIDGVLLHVAKPIPGATETLQYLQASGIPFILLTNGGGKHERDRVAGLSEQLGVPLTTDNFVQSHTPFQDLASAGGAGGLRDKNVLVTGSDPARCRAIAEAYGFRSVITPADILAAHPAVFPFDPLLKEVHAAAARPLPEPSPKIDAIFVFNDPRDWALDTQIITDLLLSEQGVLGTYSPRNGDASLPGRGWQQDGQPALYFSNHDLVWSAHYHLPRLGQGAFQAAVAGVWDQITGRSAAVATSGGQEDAATTTPQPLQRTTIGKPYPQTYRYAERVLNDYRRGLLAAGGEGGEEAAPLQRVYMVGDNPESDIRGANWYREGGGGGAADWQSLLVRTGVWSADRGPPAHTPSAIVDDVGAALDYVLKREGWSR